MPIKPENRARYPKDWKTISQRIRTERAENKCEQCKVPNGEVVFRFEDGTAYMLADGKTYAARNGLFLGYTRGSEMPAGRMVKIILTVAHLDHQPENNAEDNLKALCQRCHNRHDQSHRRANARVTRRNKLASKELFP